MKNKIYLAIVIGLIVLCCGAVYYVMNLRNRVSKIESENIKLISENQSLNNNIRDLYGIKNQTDSLGKEIILNDQEIEIIKKRIQELKMLKQKTIIIDYDFEQAKKKLGI